MLDPPEELKISVTIVKQLKYYFVIIYVWKSKEKKMGKKNLVKNKKENFGCKGEM